MSFLYMTKKSRQISKDFQVKQKACFTIFKGLSVAKNYLRRESAPLKEKCLIC